MNESELLKWTKGLFLLLLPHYIPSHVAHRIELMRSAGFSCEETAEILRLDVATVQAGGKPEVKTDERSSDSK